MMKKLVKKNAKVLLTKDAGYLGEELILSNVYLMKRGKFLIHYTKQLSAIFLVVETSRLNGISKKADFYAVAQVPRTLWGEDYFEYDWKHGMAWYIENLKKLGLKPQEAE